jgi:hypothetical protein
MHSPTTVREVELNYLHIYVLSHCQKEFLIKNCMCSFLEEYAKCILI